ncbi:hypothetical protein CBR_g51529 [Chara braunii]|uniref:Uncharacterized protein n=1 Tax=Chara braunii TaxID=69332 RepID=A0A388M8L4_CHABU|nr:hypothetical protein CBR_g51529 [Chara braunii]|eukprot:GBG90924.1 hypothetical protein CBR_g51529 [Chara braunii]
MQLTEWCQAHPSPNGSVPAFVIEGNGQIPTLFTTILTMPDGRTYESGKFRKKKESVHDAARKALVDIKKGEGSGWLSLSNQEKSATPEERLKCIKDRLTEIFVEETSPEMAISYSQAAQRAMSEKEKRDFAKGQGGGTTSHSGRTPSYSGTSSKMEAAKPRTLGQRAMEFLMEKTQIKAEIKVLKEVIKGEGGKEEEVEVWEYPEEDIQSLNEFSGEEGTSMIGEGEEDLTKKDNPEGSSQHEEDKSGSQSDQGTQGQGPLEDEAKVRERARKRGMQNTENMTVDQILQAEEDQRESSEDSESEASSASSEDDEEEEEEDQEDSDVEDWTRERWIKEVEQLEWGRTIECEIRLAHHKHVRNLQQATQAGGDITSENRFELLRREGEINEFYASQYARKSCTVKNEIHIQQEEYERLFQWPKTYHNKERKREDKKRKAQTAEEQGSTTKWGNDSMEDATMEEVQEKGEREEEDVQDLRRQAAILVVQVNLLKDENRELEDDTETHLQDLEEHQKTKLKIEKKLQSASRIDYFLTSAGVIGML